MPTASWNQLERTIERLHEAARASLGVREFYRQLVGETAAALEAAGGAAWRRGPDGRPELICQLQPDDGAEPDGVWRAEIIGKALGGGVTENASPQHGAYEILVCIVEQPGTDEDDAPPAAAIELWMPRESSPAIKQGWLDFLAAAADVATDFHARDELRRLRGASALSGQAVELLRRVGTPRTLEGAVFELANEGRRLLACDRVSVVVRRGSRWRLAAASGADAVARTEFARRTELLADHVARWGEPIEAPALAGPAGDSELPPPLAAAVEAHLDHSHARTLACAPIRFAREEPDTAKFDLVLLAERFDAGGSLRESLVEIGELCAPAMARAGELDRFAVRAALRWSQRWARLRTPSTLLRPLLIAGAIAGAIAALVLVPAPLNVEAPARVAAAVERDVFATATGSVAEVRVLHGQMVAAGDALVVLADPELSLKLQEARGEIDAARKRLDALAVSRTDRALREEGREDRLPIAAEQRELEERLVSLERQRELLELRRDELTLRSPCAGQVLTRDVQSLLESRPVERGQALLTIADVSSGWELRAEAPQRQIGLVLAALEEAAQSNEPVAASFRLAGDVRQSHDAHVIAVSTSTPLEPTGLREEAPPVEVRIAADGAAPTAMRSGMNATVQIHCGEAPLGYVWLRDVGATLYRWATF
jgi:multidrug efflux pump subunit AcrA (membrane-fusion protein)